MPHREENEIGEEGKKEKIHRWRRTYTHTHIHTHTLTYIHTDVHMASPVDSPSSSRAAFHSRLPSLSEMKLAPPISPVTPCLGTSGATAPRGVRHAIREVPVLPVLVSPLSPSSATTSLSASSTQAPSSEQPSQKPDAAAADTPPHWLTHLLTTKFYGACPAHAGVRKNELNLFDTRTCEKICQHCAAASSTEASGQAPSGRPRTAHSHSHSHHNHQSQSAALSAPPTLLHISRYMYHDVVLLREATAWMDTAHIQPYLNNGHRVLYLDRSAQPKSKLAPNAASCALCARTLQHPYKYCSLRCKLAPDVRVPAAVSQARQQHALVAPSMKKRTGAVGASSTGGSHRHTPRVAPVISKDRHRSGSDVRPSHPLHPYGQSRPHAVASATTDVGVWSPSSHAAAASPRSPGAASSSMDTLPGSPRSPPPAAAAHDSPMPSVTLGRAAHGPPASPRSCAMPARPSTPRAPRPRPRAPPASASASLTPLQLPPVAARAAATAAGQKLKALMQPAGGASVAHGRDCGGAGAALRHKRRRERPDRARVAAAPHAVAAGADSARADDAEAGRVSKSRRKSAPRQAPVAGARAVVLLRTGAGSSLLAA